MPKEKAPSKLREKFEFMDQEWGFERFPIKSHGIRGPLDPVSRAASAREFEAFERKFVLGGLKGALTYGYLWSAPDPRLPPEPTGTGYGKTTVMEVTERRINQDFGADLVSTFKLRASPSIVAAYTCLDNQDTRGLYALLYSAVERWSDPQQSAGPGGKSVLGAARELIVKALGCDPDNQTAVRKAVEQARRKIPGGATQSPMREEVIDAFCSADTEDALQSALSEVTPTMKTRNGLAWFEAAVSCLMAAGVEHVFFFLDQLEYMVTNGAVTKAQKSREIARFRTVFTQEITLANRCHVIFTLHDRASQVLESFWEINRLPSFDYQKAENQNSVVVLRGLESPDKIKDLVIPYFDAARPNQHAMRGTAKPLDPAAFQLLWEASTARPGVILRRIASALDLAATENRKVVDLALIRRVLETSGPDVSETAQAPADGVEALIR